MIKGCESGSLRLNLVVARKKSISSIANNSEVKYFALQVLVAIGFLVNISEFFCHSLLLNFVSFLALSTLEHLEIFEQTVLFCTTCKNFGNFCNIG